MTCMNVTLGWTIINSGSDGSNAAQIFSVHMLSSFFSDICNSFFDQMICTEIFQSGFSAAFEIENM